MIESAIALGKDDLQTLILRAQLYKELSYRLLGDETWKFTAAENANRAKLYKSYSATANKYYDELAEKDKSNAYEYRKKKLK